MDTMTRRRFVPPMQGSSLHEPLAANAKQPTAFDCVLAYHERTKHRLERYAAGPEALDWSGQPEPFRTFQGAPQVSLALGADGLHTSYSALHQAEGVTPHPLNPDTLAILLELSLGLSAWKEYGPDRWALRCNPSSGNLHPTEGYLICRGVSDLEDGVYHYLSRDHVLEQRCRFAASPTPVEPMVRLGLSSIHWREAWKYGERAFRYCQLDTGHALGAMRYAAAALGWGVRLVENSGWQQMAQQMGLDRNGDFSGVEFEDAELLVDITTTVPADSAMTASLDAAEAPAHTWSGRANMLDRHPMYHWPVIDEVAEATRADALTGEPATGEAYPPRTGLCEEPAAALIRQRRSAQHFDGRTEMSQETFYAILDALLARPTVPWDVWNFRPRLHPAFFVHRVEGLPSGLYILPRRAEVVDKLRTHMHDSFDWTKPVGCPDHLPFYQLAAAGCGQLAKTINCHQAIAADSAFALGMLAEFEDTVAAAPWRYRQLYWEAGLLGQVLYLEAEANGFRGTGIGCYFDDTFHELLGLTGKTFQSLYHFTVGFPLTDTRISTLPPYPGRQ